MAATMQQTHATTSTSSRASDPLANAGAFFGNTTLGATDPFFDAATTTVSYPFHLIEQHVYDEAFQRHVMGANSSVAAALRADGANCIMRANLGTILDELLGRRARKAELLFFFTFVDFDSCALMTRAEWEGAVGDLREASACPQEAREYTSYDRWRADKLRERRVAWEPQRAFQAPLTAGQEVGWHARKRLVRPPEERPRLSSTDVTRREGRTATSYFGHMNMLGAH